MRSCSANTSFPLIPLSLSLNLAVLAPEPSLFSLSLYALVGNHNDSPRASSKTHCVLSVRISVFHSIDLPFARFSPPESTRRMQPQHVWEIHTSSFRDDLETYLQCVQKRTTHHADDFSGCVSLLPRIEQRDSTSSSFIDEGVESPADISIPNSVLQDHAR